MALEQSFGEDTSLKKSNAIPVPTTSSGNIMGCFDCNICLDSARDPVVTFCGHLYCWPCIYQWLQVDNSAAGSEEIPTECPVCKSHISNCSLIPLYGRGTSSAEYSSNESDVTVPQRPQGIWTTTRQVHTSSSSIHQEQYFSHHAFGGYAAAVGPSTSTRLFSPIVVMFGEMFLARMLGGSDTSSYPIPGGGSTRMRRQEMQVDKSLNRLSIFLFCAFILCLLLF
ncbi:E3 ubiquitin-protein ligase RMA3-like [Capsicum chacoense]